VRSWRLLIVIMLSVSLLLLGSDSWRAAFDTRYDAIVLGSGLKESLVSSMLASQGKRVLHLDQEAPGGESRSVDMQTLYERLVGPDAAADPKLGTATDYNVDLTPKALMASGKELQLLVNSGLWKHMDFRRVHRSLIYRLKPDGSTDIHRILSNSEDVLKTRMLPALDKAKVIKLFFWLEQFDEKDPATFTAGTITKKRLNLQKLSALAFFRFWDLQPETIVLLAQGMGGYLCSLKELKRVPAIDLVRSMKRYKDSYRTFPHMTSPYVFPAGGLGTTLAKACTKVVEGAGGASFSRRPIDSIAYDEAGRACGVCSEGVTVKADAVIAAPAYVPERVEQQGQVVRLFAVLSHAPHKCKDARSCSLVIPATQCGRSNDIFVFSSGASHGVAPAGKWLVTAATRIEGSTDGKTALEVAKRELAAVLPILRPTRKMLAEITPIYAARGDAAADGLHIVPSCDETLSFDGVAADAEGIFDAVVESSE